MRSVAETRTKSRLGKLSREHNEWQIREIQTALKEADRGEFATGAEVRAVFERWNAR